MTGHLQTHGIFGDENSEIVQSLSGNNDKTDSEPTTNDGGALSESDDVAPEGLTCRRCGSSDRVQSVDRLEEQAREQGKGLAEEVKQHSHFCGRCNYAFDRMEVEA